MGGALDGSSPTGPQKKPIGSIGVRVGKVINTYKVGKHFELVIDDNGFDYEVDQSEVAAEAALDGIYVIRTSLPDQRMKAEQVVLSYKLLSQNDRAFRSMKAVDLNVRPIRHRLENRVRTHIFLCMLAYYRGGPRCLDSSAAAAVLR